MKRWLAGSGRGFRLAVKKLEHKERWEEFWSKVDDMLSSIPKTRREMSDLMYGKVPKGR